ncbi:hypothetical protein ANN_02137 [Periplaneta americana]|uniref:Reverse transcriptase domain-containing protein n=1 Tax=Periplaneta americana TaxID=6978 RepID=A0ABQ8TXY4_PERAM|nr:hypothetical protein ANN_02137 [Periplaneta americana]
MSMRRCDGMVLLVLFHGESVCSDCGGKKALLAEEEMILSDMLLELNDSCEQYGMKINANKTKTMVIGRKVKKVNLRILNEAVEIQRKMNDRPKLVMNYNENMDTIPEEIVKEAEGGGECDTSRSGCMELARRLTGLLESCSARQMARGEWLYTAVAMVTGGGLSSRSVDTARGHRGDSSAASGRVGWRQVGGIIS